MCHWDNYYSLILKAHKSCKSTFTRVIIAFLVKCVNIRFAAFKNCDNDKI